MPRSSEATRPAKPVWSRDFTLFLTARTVSILGDQMLVPITVTVAVLQAGYGVTGVGLALALTPHRWRSSSFSAVFWLTASHLCVSWSSQMWPG